MEADQSRSDRKLIIETAWTTAPFLGYSVAIYVIARLLNYTSSYAFRLLRWLGRWTLYGLEKALFGLAWLAQWLAFIAAILILIFLALLGIAYILSAREPQLSALWRKHARAALVLVEATCALPLLWLLSRWLPYWITYPLLGLAGIRWGLTAMGVPPPALVSTTSIEKWLNGRRDRGRHDAAHLARDATVATSAMPSPGSREERLRTIREAVEKAERERDERRKESQEATNWARQVQEEMLREGLAKRAHKAATAAAPTADEDADSHDTSESNRESRTETIRT